MGLPNLFPAIGFAIYAVVSKLLFDKIYITSNVIVDEEFHMPLGQRYCRYRFREWDPKVTTLPGLYLSSTLLLGPLGLCTKYWLRATSLMFSGINLVLFYMLVSKTVKGQWQKVITALAIAFLPPLYFLAHVYYTDVVSLTTILLLITFHERRYHYFAALAGFLSIMCRQTNVVFVGIYGGTYVLREIYGFWAKHTVPYVKAGRFPLKDMKPFIKDLVKDPMRILRHTTPKFWVDSACYTSVLVFFITFVFLNGGIVVGDKSAHTVSINIPQIFYFSVFCMIFAWPFFVCEIFHFFDFVTRQKLVIFLSIIVALLVVHFNTVVHPYLLADNRHFIFYVWNRFYGKYSWFKYSMVPIYIFALYVVIKTIWDKSDISFSILFFVGVGALLASQSLLELRYFLVPYIIFRLKVKNKDQPNFNLGLEFFTHSLLNMSAFKIFFTIPVYWQGYNDTQRIIW